MNSLKIEEKVRELLENIDFGVIEDLLVDAADWGINIRMMLNHQFIEIDLIKNWDGFEVIRNDQYKRDSIQIDDLQDLLPVLKGDY